MTSALTVARLVGSFRWSSRGVLLHLLPADTERALCGAKPKGISNGWAQRDNEPATCPRCLERAAKHSADQP